jgi:ubiquinone/menaquinone biosynthesis C-methylase UbiE
VNRYGWMRWIFDQLRFGPTSRILDLGCGPASLWQENLNRVPQGWHIVLSDLSVGMVREAQRNLNGSDCFEYQVIDAQALPFENEGFDGVIANHVLYHVPDIERALSEIGRVLRNGGRFYATTVGQSHLRELYELVSRFAGDNEMWVGGLPESFALENGSELLSRWFSEVVMMRYEDELVVTEVEPLVVYVRSMMVAKSVLGDGRVKAFAEMVKRKLAQRGAIKVTKDSGMFEAMRSWKSSMPTTNP